MKLIEAKMRPDWIEPYASCGGLIPVVLTSSHTRFRPGHRLDWGFVMTALNEGYTIVIEPIKEGR